MLCFYFVVVVKKSDLLPFENNRKGTVNIYIKYVCWSKFNSSTWTFTCNKSAFPLQAFQYIFNQDCNTTGSEKYWLSPFSLTNLDKYWYCTAITEKVWQRLPLCTVRTDKLRQLLISSDGAEKLWQRLRILLYVLINLDKYWRLCWTHW